MSAKKRPNFIPVHRNEEKSIKDQIDTDSELDLDLDTEGEEPTLDDLLDTSPRDTLGPAKLDEQVLGQPSLSVNIKGSLTFKQTMQLGAFQLAMESTIQKYMSPGGLKRKKELVRVFIQDALFLAELVGEAYDEISRD